MACVCLIPEASVHYNGSLEMAYRLVVQQKDANIHVFRDQMRKILYVTVLATTPIDAGLLDKVNTS